MVLHGAETVYLKLSRKPPPRLTVQVVTRRRCPAYEPFCPSLLPLDYVSCLYGSATFSSASVSLFLHQTNSVLRSSCGSDLVTLSSASVLLLPKPFKKMASALAVVTQLLAP